MAATRKERIAKLYLVMSKIYGHLFTSVNKTEVDIEIWISVWTQALSDLTDAQIERGQNKMIKEIGKVPTPKEFIAACKLTQLEAINLDQSTDFLRIENDVPTKKDWRDIAAIDYQKNHPEIKNIPETESDKKKMLSMSLLKIKHSQNDKPKKKNTYNDTEYLNKKKEQENNERLD